MGVCWTSEYDGERGMTVKMKKKSKPKRRLLFHVMRKYTLFRKKWVNGFYRPRSCRVIGIDTALCRLFFKRPKMDEPNDTGRPPWCQCGNIVFLWRDLGQA